MLKRTILFCALLELGAILTVKLNFIFFPQCYAIRKWVGEIDSRSFLSTHLLQLTLTNFKNAIYSSIQVNISFFQNAPNLSISYNIA